MRKRLYEIMGVPPQYREDGPPEYPTPPDEFNRFAPVVQEPERARSRIMRIMLLFGVSGLIVVGLLFSRANVSVPVTQPIAPTVQASFAPSPSPESTAAVHTDNTSVPTEEPRPEETAVPSSAPSDTPSSAPSDTPSPAPTETPAPHETPSIDALYYNFSAQYHLTLSLSDAEELTSCEAVITDSVLGHELLRHTLTEDELAAGMFEMEPFWLDEYWFEHRAELEELNAYPEPVLTVRAVYSTADGEVELTKEVKASEETGWSIRYDAPDAAPGDYTYPGCLFFGTYEAFGIAPSVAIDDPSVTRFGGISLSVTVGGVPVSKEDCTIKERALTIFDEETGYYMTDVIIPIPENAPEHGTAHFSITQQLMGYGRTVTFERDIEY